MNLLKFTIPIIILILSFNLLIFNNDFYGKESNNATVSNNIIDYFKGNELNSNYFSDKEISHLKDVRNLIWMSLVILIILTIILLISISNKEIFLGSLFSIILTILLALTLLSFSTSFVYFHQILFTNNNWLLPANSTLIQTLPESFFEKAFIKILITNFIISILLLLISLAYRYIYPKLSPVVR